MKDSGIEWLGKIPNNWRTIRVKYAFRIKKEIAGELGHTVLSVTQRGIKPKDMSEKGQFSLDYSKYQLVSSGDFIMNHMDLLTGWVDISNMDGVTSPDYRVFQSSNPEKYYPDFYRYVFQTCYQQRIFYGLGQGVSGFGRWRLPAEIFLNFYLPVPPYESQSAIAAYLDTQCAKIDEIIAQAKASIEDYKQWKASIIYEAVTKGLDPNVEMKDSGVEGIVEIPNHWRTLRIKYVSSLDAICDTSHISPDDVVTFAPMECIRNDIRIPKVATKSKDNGTYSSFIDGDIAIAKVTPCFENGNICIMDNLENGYAFGSSELFSLRPYGIDRRYFFYCLQTPTFIDGGAATMTGVGGLKRVSSYYMKNALIPIPPLEEQRTIAKFLGKKTALIATLISEKETLIDDLESYKKSLIYETVTGKGRVC